MAKSTYRLQQSLLAWNRSFPKQPKKKHVAGRGGNTTGVFIPCTFRVMAVEEGSWGLTLACVIDAIGGYILKK